MAFLEQLPPDGAENLAPDAHMLKRAQVASLLAKRVVTPGTAGVSSYALRLESVISQGKSTNQLISFIKKDLELQGLKYGSTYDIAAGLSITPSGIWLARLITNEGRSCAMRWPALGFSVEERFFGSSTVPEDKVLLILDAPHPHQLEVAIDTLESDQLACSIQAVASVIDEPSSPTAEWLEQAGIEYYPIFTTDKLGNYPAV